MKIIDCWDSRKIIYISANQKNLQKGDFMRIRQIFAICLAFSFAVMIACGGGEQVKKDETAPQVQAPSVGADQWVSASNAQLEKIPVEGFGYKSSSVPAQKWDRWATAAAPVVQNIINQLPAGYVLQVTGHADARGPEEPTGNKPGNIKISSDRAKTVYDALKRKGITSPKMTYKGVGSSDLLSGYSPQDAAQRRVSFKVVPE